MTNRYLTINSAHCYWGDNCNDPRNWEEAATITPLFGENDKDKGSTYCSLLTLNV